MPATFLPTIDVVVVVVDVVVVGVVVAVDVIVVHGIVAPDTLYMLWQAGCHAQIENLSLTKSPC